MREFLYLAFGFALLFLLHRGERSRGARELFEWALEASLAYAFLLTLDLAFTLYLWEPSGRTGFRLPSLFLWAFLIDQVRSRLVRRIKEKGEIRLFLSRFFLAALGACFWAIENTKAGPYGQAALSGFALIFTAVGIEWLLDGLRERVKLAWVPPPLEGAPILLCLAALLFLAIAGYTY